MRTIPLAAGLAFCAAVLAAAPAGAQQFRGRRGGQSGAMASGQQFSRGMSGASSLSASGTTGTQSGMCQNGSQSSTGQRLNQSGIQAQGMGMGQAAGTGQTSGVTQVTVAPVRNASELTQLVKAVEAMAGGASYQVRPTGDAQSATVAVAASGTNSGTTLAQGLQSTGFQILEVSVQGNTNTGRMATQGTSSTMQRSYQAGPMYGQTTAAVQNMYRQQAQAIQQSRRGIQSQSRARR